jgi:hypothetical protein
LLASHLPGLHFLRVKKCISALTVYAYMHNLGPAR